MEEILASIRRIISEDDAPAAAAPEPAAAPPPAPLAEAPRAHEPAAPQPPPSPGHDDDDVLELDQPIPAAAPARALGDLELVSSRPPEPPPAPEPRPQMSAPRDDHSLISDRVLSSAAAHFDQLEAGIGMPASDRTLEDVVKALLKPLLADWLNEHLEGIVREEVAEVAKSLAAQRRRV